MTSNNRLKKHARAYAAERGIPYTQARRELLDGVGAVVDRMTETGDGPEIGQQRVLTIQQVLRDDDRLPYPFHIDEAGFVLRQDFWRGKPLRLVGFVDDPDVYKISLNVEDWQADPDAAIGKHPVLSNREGRFSTYTGAVETVTVSYLPRTEPDSVPAQFGTSDDAIEAQVGVGDLLGYLTDDELRTLREQDWVVGPEVGDLLLGWRVGTAAAVEATGFEALLDYLDEHGADEDEPGDEGVQVRASLDKTTADAWLATHRPNL